MLPIRHGIISLHVSTLCSKGGKDYAESKLSVSCSRKPDRRVAPKVLAIVHFSWKELVLVEISTLANVEEELWKPKPDKDDGE